MDAETGKKLTRSASGLRMVPTAEKFASPFALEEPMWTPDKDATKCISCQQVYDFMNRRHHCRRCGKCYCSRCCANVIPLQRMYFIDPVKQCYDCAVISKKEQDFYERSLKILMSGTNLLIDKQTLERPTEKEGYLCRFTSDHRYLEFMPEKGMSSDCIPSKVLLTKIVGAQVLTAQQSSAGSEQQRIPTGLTLKYKDEEDSAITNDLILHAVNQKASALWLLGAQKALKMIFESRHQKVQE